MQDVELEEVSEVSESASSRCDVLEMSELDKLCISNLGLVKKALNLGHMALALGEIVAGVAIDNEEYSTRYVAMLNMRTSELSGV